MMTVEDSRKSVEKMVELYNTFSEGKLSLEQIKEKLAKKEKERSKLQERRFIIDDWGDI